MTVRVIGAPASGKTFLRDLLGKALNVPTYSIDDERLALMEAFELWPSGRDHLAWSSLRQKVAQGPCVVETQGVSPHDDLEGFTVLCVASHDVRRKRLEERVQNGYRFAARWDRAYAYRLLSSTAPTHGDVVYDGNDPQPVVEACQTYLNGVLTC